MNHHRDGYGYGYMSVSYLACLDSVILHHCPTCGATPEQRCTSTSGRDLSITHTHKPRIAALQASYQAVQR